MAAVPCRPSAASTRAGRTLLMDGTSGSGGAPIHGACTSLPEQCVTDADGSNGLVRRREAGVGSVAAGLLVAQRNAVQVEDARGQRDVRPSDVFRARALACRDPADVVVPH